MEDLERDHQQEMAALNSQVHCTLRHSPEGSHVQSSPILVTFRDHPNILYTQYVFIQFIFYKQTFFHTCKRFT